LHAFLIRAQKEEYEGVILRLKEKGCVVKFPVELEGISALTVDGEHAIMPIACECDRLLEGLFESNYASPVWDFKNLCIPRFLQAFDECPVKSLDDIVKFNEEHKDKCLPSGMSRTSHCHSIFIRVQ
jgi:amidase